MPDFDAKLFKKYDIRGRASGDGAPLTDEVARYVGQAFGSYLEAAEGLKTVVVGRDNRHSSVALAAGAIDGLRASGCTVIDIGLVSTPMIYWRATRAGNIGGLMVTGSHLAPDQNGFKLCVGPRPVYGEAIQMIRAMIVNEDYANGTGELTVDADIRANYVADLVSRVPMARPLKVVIDPGNGTAGLIAPQLLQAWGHDVTCIFCEPDGSYPNHQPDPQVQANVKVLGEKVREAGADVGIAFDGDADRMGAVDERGRLVAGDRVLALLARDLLGRHPGAAVVADVLSSQVLFDEIARAGGVPYMGASGHALIKARMAEVGALLGGEMSGHIFLAEDYYGFDDAFMAAGRLLQLLAGGTARLSELDAGLPTLYATPEYRPHCADEAKQRVIDGVAVALQGEGEIETVDGVRVRFERGWGIIRASNTEPVLSLRFEGETEADALDYRNKFAAALKAFPEVEPMA